MKCRAVFAATLLAAAGCGPGKLDVSDTMTLDPSETKSKELPPQKAAQKVTVEYESPVEIDVLVFKTTDLPAELQNVTAAKAITHNSRVKSGSLSVDVPANTGTTVVLTGAKKKTDVKLHITNQK